MLFLLFLALASFPSLGLVSAAASSLERPTPTSVAAWKAYDMDPTLQRLDPSFTSHTRVTSSKYMVRDRVLDLPFTLGAANNSSARYLTAYSDVLLLESDAQIQIPTVAQIVTRVLATDGNTTLTVSQTDGERPNARSTLYLIAPTMHGRVFVNLLDTPWEGYPIELAIGKPERNEFVGVSLTLFGPLATPSLVYLTADDVDKLLMESEDLTNALTAQLLAATSLFWTWPRMSLDIASYVAVISSRSMAGKFVYMQAQSVAEWLRARLAVGPDAHPAPNLDLATYRQAVDNALDVALVFENRYNQLTDQSAREEDRIAAWGAMVDTATDQLSVHRILAGAAEAEYQAAEATLGGVLANFHAQTVFLAAVAAKFEQGVESYVEEQENQRIFDIATDLLTIALSCGSFAGPGQFLMEGWAFLVDNVDVSAATVFELDVPAQEQVQTWMDTIINSPDPSIFDSTTNHLQDITANTVEEAKTIEAINAIRKIVASGRGLRDASVSTQQLVLDSRDMVTVLPTQSPHHRTEGEMGVLWDEYLASNAWWIEHCVDLNIEGARELRVEMEKLTLRGKLVAAAESHLVRMGQDLVRARLAVYTAERDVERLEVLKTRFEETHELTEEARMAFYQRRMSVRTDLIRRMDNATQAYRYQTLRDSGVVLDPTASLEDLASRALSAENELLDWKSTFSSPPQKFTKIPMFASELGVQGRELIASLKNPNTNHTGRFALQPESLAGSTPGPFTGGGYFHITALEVYLLGLEPVSSRPSYPVKVSVFTTGSYQNTRDRGDVVLDFVMRPHARVFQYTVDEASSAATVNVYANFGGTEWTTPTPFGEWAIYVWDADRYDLTGLTDVMIVWEGEAYFETMPTGRKKLPEGADMFLTAGHRPQGGP